MATVMAIDDIMVPASSVLAPEIEIPSIPVTETEVREAAARIRANWSKLSKASMEIGWDGFLIERANGWHLVGALDEHDFRRQLGIGRSTWYAATAAARRLAHLTRDQFLAMTLENAKQLGAATEEQKRDPGMIQLAATSTTEELADHLVVDEARRAGKPVGEVYVTMKIRLKQAQRQVIERGVRDWCREHGIEDEAMGLELLVAEYHDRLTLVGFMTESLRRLRPLLLDTADTRALLANHLSEMDAVLRMCCGEQQERENDESVHDLLEE